ncbi:MAG: phospho-N-acetylmuramoyl-pentapeptide-transferase [Campylobacterota bacterium]|nr:phospho-N-acetylmuramoyl-pentapeptide-transferase [Campylobacterota bacterium]
MLYWLYETVSINILQYITVRAGIAFFIALFLTLFLMPKFIKWAQNGGKTQPINDYAPDKHKQKASTPTMGGVVFIFSTIVASFLSVQFTCPYVGGALLTLALFSFIGFKDDISKIRQNENLAGLSARSKLILQFGSASVIGAYLYFFAGLNSDLYIPFYKNPLLDMGFYSIILWALVLVATSNAVNLTDGLDGLATVPSIFALTTLGVVVYITGNAVISKYLLMPNFAVGEVTIVSSALIGSLVGFLWFNSHPAEVFMGDSGSLTLGAFIAYMAIIAKSEILLFFVGFIFVIETVSVILQVGSYKIRKKRVFLMAPIHHHFEMKNWAENKIIVRFWIISMLSNLVALISLKIR